MRGLFIDSDSPFFFVFLTHLCGSLFLSLVFWSAEDRVARSVCEPSVHFVFPSVFERSSNVVLCALGLDRCSSHRPFLRLGASLDGRGKQQQRQKETLLFLCRTVVLRNEAAFVSITKEKAL